MGQKLQNAMGAVIEVADGVSVDAYAAAGFKPAGGKEAEAPKAGKKADSK